jgi:hypothetical protein
MACIRMIGIRHPDGILSRNLTLAINKLLNGLFDLREKVYMITDLIF